MQKKAYVFTVGTVIAAAFAFFMRWLQNINIMDEETGLAARGAPISVIIVLVLLATAGVYAYFTRSQMKYTALTDPDEAMPMTLPGEKYIALLIGILLGVAGILQFAQADLEHWAEADVTVHKISALAAVVGAVGYMMTAASSKTGARCTGSALLTLFGCVWLVAVYKTAASDPVIWRNIIAILAVCAATLSFYYIAGYHFGETHPAKARWACAMGAFLCIMTLIDDHTSGESIAYLSAALMQLLWLYRLIIGLRDPAEEPEGSAASESSVAEEIASEE